MSVESSVGKTTAADLTTYEVRTIDKGQTSDSKTYVSSKTGGKTYREPGNLDRTWEISLYAPDGITEVPAALKAGQIITVQVTGDVAGKRMLINDAHLVVDIEGGELIAIALSCAAVDGDSY